jgi:hypothetical protein
MTTNTMAMTVPSRYSSSIVGFWPLLTQLSKFLLGFRVSPLGCSSGGASQLQRLFGPDPTVAEVLELGSHMVHGSGQSQTQDDVHDEQGNVGHTPGEIGGRGLGGVLGRHYGQTWIYVWLSLMKVFSY